MNVFIHGLKQADIFIQLSQTQLEKIAGICSEKAYHTGDLILLEGSHTDELYIITQGEVDILINPSLVSSPERKELAPVTIATLRRGQSFGEIALVDQGMRSATVRAAQHSTRVLVIPSNELLALCEADPSLGYRLMRNLAADLAMKIRNADLRLRENLMDRSGLPDQL